MHSPLYRELHSEKNQENPKVHERFLDRLKKILPANSEVIIITDSGFLSPWFKKVRSLGWDFVGRIPSNVHFRLIGKESSWCSVGELYKEADAHPRKVGQVELGKTRKEPLNCQLITYKKLKQGRKKYKTKGQPLYPDAEKRYRNMNKNPWILATSLEGKKGLASIVKNIYSKRMQIEQNFRDDKNMRWGLGLRYSRTKKHQRLEMLLLIAVVGQYLLWLIGITGEHKKLHWKFQSHSVKKWRVLAWITLAKQIVFHLAGVLKAKDFTDTLKEFYGHYQESALC